MSLFVGKSVAAALSALSSVTFAGAISLTTVAAGAMTLDAAGALNLGTSTATLVTIGNSPVGGATVVFNSKVLAFSAACNVPVFCQNDPAAVSVGNGTSAFTMVVHAANGGNTSAVGGNGGAGASLYLQAGHGGTQGSGGTVGADGSVNFGTTSATWATFALAGLSFAAASTVSTAAGALTVDSFAALNLGTSAATSIAIGKSGITTTVTGGLTQQTGAFSLTGNASSQISTSSGNLTLDCAGNGSIFATNCADLTIGRTGANCKILGSSMSLTAGSFIVANTINNFNLIQLAAATVTSGSKPATPSRFNFSAAGGTANNGVGGGGDGADMWVASGAPGANTGGGAAGSPGAILFITGATTQMTISKTGQLSLPNITTQSTIGANGAASALTALPVGYMQITIGATLYVIPYYNH